MRSFLLLCVAALTSSFVFANHVLIVGKSQAPLWHESSSSSTFSVAGLVDLALESLAFPTGRVSSRPVVQNPVQADIFTHSEAYALILLDDASLASLEAVNAALSGVNAFHKLYPTAQASNVEIPLAVAQKFQSKYPSSLHCAGNVALCANVEASTPFASTELVQKVLDTNIFLSSNDEQDVVFAKQLAQVMQLTADIKQHDAGKILYIVGLSSLHGDKQKPAQQAAAITVMEFLAQLMKKEQAVAAQVMTGNVPATVDQVAALSRRVRKLASSLTEGEASAEDDAKDEEGKAEEAASGSVPKDVVHEDNATTTTNSTAMGAASMSDIAEYQIILWTSVVLGAVLFMSVMAMANMDARRDSLLNAKFIADVNGRKSN